MTSAGYSGTPLPKKLGIGDDSTVLLWHGPPDLELPLPPGVVVARQCRGTFDVVVAFFTERAVYDRRIEGLSKAITPRGGLWVAWPKRSSGVDTDMTDDAVRSTALPLGLVDNKVCAIDATWTGLRLVWRLDQRR